MSIWYFACLTLLLCCQVVTASAKPDGLALKQRGEETAQGLTTDAIWFCLVSALGGAGLLSGYLR